MSDQRPTVSILTLGCKLNQADSEALARRLMDSGVRVVPRPDAAAQAFVINTCSVTHVADRKGRHLARLARCLAPNAQVILTGCYAERMGHPLAARLGVDLVLGNGAKPFLPDRLLERLAQKGDPAAGFPPPVRDSLRTRAFVKIQEGCDELCAFCIVPYTRGRERSVPIDQVVQEVLSRQHEGALEVVLTGTQLGNYGRDLGRREPGPLPLLETLLERTSLPRIRLSSLQAQDISPRLLSLWQDRRLCPHFHLPLQSGSDHVLRRMRRRYSTTQFRQATEMIQERLPDAAITTDIIVGFPGETETDFEATLDLCREVGFAAIHAFPYSRRPGTGAALLDQHVPLQAKRARLERLLAESKKSATAFRERFLGRVLPVLWEQQRDGCWQGLTANYLRVYTSAHEHLANHLIPTRLVALRDEGLVGSLEPNGGLDA